MDSVQDIASYLEDEFGLSEAETREMITEYIENTELLIKLASDSLANCDWETLHRAGHSIKGTSCNLGADILASKGDIIQTAAENKNRELCLTIVSELNTALSTLKQTID